MSQEGKPDFYTQKGYQMRSQHALTGAMEDYLEMICRQAEADGCARIGLLAEGLNVRPSSASKMVYQLRTLGLVAFEKYGLIQPTEKGWSVGRWLLHRHEVLHRFFCMLNGSTDELELVEQVEHYLNEGTVRNLEALLERLEAHYGVKPILYVTYRSYYRYIAGGGYGDYPIWCSSPTVFPLVPGWDFWQYSHSAELEGYYGTQRRIDLNIFRGSQAEFERFG